MIGELPTTLTVNNKVYNIRSDFRNIFRILEAYEDADLYIHDKIRLCLKRLYVEAIPYRDMQEAYEKACWFIDGGEQYKRCKPSNTKLVDWQQDEMPLFAAINNVARCEVRSLEYLHWWTFLSYYMSINGGLFSQIISIRIKKLKGKKLEKYEEEFYKANRDMIVIRKHISSEQQEEIDRLNKLLG